MVRPLPGGLTTTTTLAPKVEGIQETTTTTTAAPKTTVLGEVLTKQGELPHTVVVAPGGRVVYRSEGAFDPLALRKAIVGYYGRYYHSVAGQ